VAAVRAVLRGCEDHVAVRRLTLFIGVGVRWRYLVVICGQAERWHLDVLETTRHYRLVIVLVGGFKAEHRYVQIIVDLFQSTPVSVERLLQSGFFLVIVKELAQFRNAVLLNVTSQVNANGPAVEAHALRVEIIVASFHIVRSGVKTSAVEFRILLRFLQIRT